jgi:hypothetical protein
MDPDPGGPKTYGSYGSGSGSATLLSVHRSTRWYKLHCTVHKDERLKVPKCEIFDRSDFPDFYTIKSRREGDFGVKIKKF